MKRRSTRLWARSQWSCWPVIRVLGRALQARGEIEPARKAFEAAVTHLSNTVDADHPELVRALELWVSSGDLIKADRRE